MQLVDSGGNLLAVRGDFRSPANPGDIVSDIAVVLLDPEGQVPVGSWAGEELGLGDAAVVAVPVTGQEGPAFDADFLEEFLAGRIVTLTQNPGPPGSSGARRPTGSKARQSQHLFFSIDEVPHLVELHDRHQWSLRCKTVAGDLANRPESLARPGFLGRRRTTPGAFDGGR
jgi:hypothetical protein